MVEKREWCIVVLFDAVCGVLALCALAVSVRSLKGRKKKGGGGEVGGRGLPVGVV